MAAGLKALRGRIRYAVSPPVKHERELGCTKGPTLDNAIG